MAGQAHVVPIAAAAPLAYTDIGNAEFFAAKWTNKARYDHRRGRWLLWRQHRWHVDIEDRVYQLAKLAMRQRFVDAAAIVDSQERARAAKWAITSEARPRLEGLLHLARTEPAIRDAGDRWDHTPWLLGVPNGVVDLQTGERRDGQREDRITMSAAVPFDSDARSELWERTLRDVLGSDEAVDFFQVAAGYSTTGDMRRDCWFLTVGTGRNGKGTLLHPIRRALGDYAMELPAAVFDLRRDATPYDLAALPGKRFVMSSESGDTIRLHHDRIKQISGGDPIRAANKYERSFEFEPTCKLWLSANRKPRVSDDSPAFWARVLTVQFPRSFVGRENRDLRPTLAHDPTHQVAVLAWLVRGAVRYYAEGLYPPASVTAATAQYQEESDPLAEFCGVGTAREPDSEVRAADLYAHYCDWARRQGFSDRERLTATMFGRLMGRRFTTKRANTGKVYLDVTLTPFVEEQ